MIHPRITTFVGTAAEIASMSDEELNDLASHIGLDVEAATDHEVDLDRVSQEYSMCHPAFTGHLEFDLTMELLREVVQRKARLAFSYTPQWAHFDLHVQAERLGWEYRSVSIDVLTVPEVAAWSVNSQLDAVHVFNEQRWVPLHLDHRGLLPDRVWDEIDRLIDEHCRKENENRRKAGSNRGR